MIHSSPTFRRMAKIRKRFASGWTLLIPLVVANGRYLLASFSRKTICDCRCTCVTCKTSFAPFARIFTFTDSGYIRLDENRAIADTWKFARRVPHSLLFFSLSPSRAQCYRFRSRFREAFAQPRSIFTTRLGVPIARPFRFGRSLSRTRPWFLADFRWYSQSADIERASGCATSRLWPQCALWSC